MKRREFIGLVGGAAAWPVVARAQQAVKVARIGWMSRGSATANDPNMNAFRQGMRELGYVEGQSFLLEPRYADGKTELMLDQAAELERIGVDVIIAGPFEALAGRQAKHQPRSHHHDTQRRPRRYRNRREPRSSGREYYRYHRNDAGADTAEAQAADTNRSKH